MPKNTKKAESASSSSDSDSGPDDRLPVKKAKTTAAASSSSSTTNKDGNKCWELDQKKRATVRSFGGKTFVDIREYYLKDGDWSPSKKGITLQLAQFRKLLEVADEITKELESK